MYEVGLVDPAALNRRACIRIYNSIAQNDTLSVMEQKAHTYWQGSNIQLPELLTVSPIRIVAQHEV